MNRIYSLVSFSLSLLIVVFTHVLLSIRFLKKRNKKNIRHWDTLYSLLGTVTREDLSERQVVVQWHLPTTC